MTIEICSRQRAIAEGRLKYYTGVPCKNGHLSQRYVLGYFCIACISGRSEIVKNERDRNRTKPIPTEHLPVANYPEYYTRMEFAVNADIREVVKDFVDFANHWSESDLEPNQLALVIKYMEALKKAEQFR
jgi:hypothetical protein